MSRSRTVVASRRVRATGAVLLAAALVAPASSASAAGGQDLTFHGSLVVLTGDAIGSASPPPDGREMVEVDDTLVDLPDGLTVGGRTGDPVTVTVHADQPLSAAAALDVVTVPQPGDTARVVSVVPDQPTAGASAATSLASTLGTHSLLVLPVFTTAPGSAPDGATQASLLSLARTTAAYWSTQSNGRIAITASANAWHQVAAPATACDTATLFNEALAANGNPPVDSTHHVLVYFPNDSSCGGWAGLASVGGGQIWVNGEPVADVVSHEFGHNLGLGHAKSATCSSTTGPVSLSFPITSCTIVEYGDFTDVMGIGSDLATGNLNSGFADYLGLANVTHVPVGGTATVDLAPLGSVTALRAVAIPVSGGTVYVDYRPAVAPDLRMPAWAGVQVRYLTVEPGGYEPVTYLLNMQPSTPSFKLAGWPTGVGTPGSAVSLPAGSSWVIPGTSEAVSVVATGATARVVVGSAEAAASAGIQHYITKVYADLFHRGVDDAGLATWTHALLTGTPRVAVANAITNSTEYRSSLIQGSYQRYLGRSAEPAGLAFWLDRMSAGLKTSDLEAGFLASDEYYRNSGSDPGTWATRLYQDVLGRTPSASEVSFWVGQQAVHGRSYVATGFLLSSEHLAAVIDGYYHDLLGRGIDPSGRATWVGQIQQGVRLETVIGSIIASSEYYSKAQVV